MKPEILLASVLALLVVGGGAFIVLRTPHPAEEVGTPLPSEQAQATSTTPAGVTALIATLTNTDPARTAKLTKLAGPSRPYVEIVNPSGFVNTQGVTVKEFIGKKVVLIDFMTYSCINCQRTFPYVTAWYNKYKNDGLVVIGIHTPEFAFEKDIQNVRDAMKRFGITYPVVLDNEYGTWNAYANQFWPREYLIDIHGNIVYDHTGEGNYDVTEKAIQDALAERATLLNTKGVTDTSTVSIVPANLNGVSSPETYFGASRNTLLANGTSRVEGTQSFTLPNNPALNKLYLGGSWDMKGEYALSQGETEVLYKYSSKDVYMVASASSSVVVDVVQDGSVVGKASGADVNSAGSVTIGTSRLYHLVHNATAGEHVLKLKVHGKGAQLFTFTFG